MGIDIGFDFFPPIDANNIGDTALWDLFLKDVIDEYRRDPNVEVKENGDIQVKQSEHPILFHEGHKFRRFSSKVSGRLAGDVQSYLTRVCSIARDHFNDRVHWWSEYGYEGEPRAIYDWNEVYAANKEHYLPWTSRS
ncbi:hypothetical protein BDZ89DRAFT_1064279 [Hymenopellis radicata]|nr:hypothetical protein BDZ89DRAFT_1064279 [Hymenopellis radicata]